MRLSVSCLFLSMIGLAGCQTAQQAKEIKLLGFTEDASKGTSTGPIEGADCVFQVFGYWLGGQPTLSKAVMNARSGKSTSITDSFGSADMGTGGVRYFNNMTVSNDGFNAVVFGKQCIKVSAVGYK